MAAEMNTVVEGCLKYRDGKKWKSRYCVIKKPSPVADRLLVSLYKEEKDLHVTHRGPQPKTTLIIEDYYGIEADLNVDKENYVLALICQKTVTVFAFEHRELMLHFEINIRRSLGQDQQYPVTVCKVPTQSKLPLGPAMLHIHGQKFCLTANKPPKLLMSWNIPELRRFGPVDGRFMFEGGSRCGKGTGVHGFESNNADEIYRNFQPSNTGRGQAKRPHAWRRQKHVDVPISPGGRYQELTNLLNADHNFRVNDRMHTKRHSIGVVDYKEAVETMEKNRLMSIENVDQERLTRIYDIPPQLVRKVESSPNIPEMDAEMSILANRNSGDGTRSNRNSGDGTRSNTNSGDGTRSNRNSGDGTKSNRNSGDGSRSSRNSGDGTRSNRNSGDGTRSNRNSGDGTRSNRNSGEGKRSKRNSSDGNRSNRNSSDSSHSSRNSGDGCKIRPRKYSAENGFHRHSDFAHRSSLALRKSLDNILAGNQNWIEDFDNEFEENTLSRKNMYKSTSALCSLLSGTETVFEDNFEMCNRSESVPHLLAKECVESKLCEGNHELEKLTKQEEILQREMVLLDEMLQVCVDGNEDSSKTETGMSQGFADALATLTIDTDLLDYSDPKTNDIKETKNTDIQQDPALLSPNLTSKIKRVPSCSKLAAPLPYLNLEKYDLRLSSSDHVHVPAEYVFVRRGVSYDNLSSVTKQSISAPHPNFRSKSLSCSDSSSVTANLESEGLVKKNPPPLPPKTVPEESSPPELPPKGPNLLRKQKGMSSLFNTPAEYLPRVKLTKPLSIANRQDANRQYQLPRSGPPRVFKPTPPLPESEDSYTAMDDILSRTITPRRTSLICMPVQEVSEDDPKSAYMDMSKIFDVPRPSLHKSSSGPAFYGSSNITGKSIGSQSAKTSFSEQQTSKLLESSTLEPLDEPLDNYFLMSSVSPTDLPDSRVVFSCDGEERNANSYTDTKGAVPFSDLITVQSYRSSQTIELSSSVDTANNNTLDFSSSVEKLDSSSILNKSTSFFSRLIQKAKLKDKKLYLTSSEDLSKSQKKQESSSSTINFNRSPVSPEVPALPKRSASICQQNGTKLLAIPGADRQRSSSVPNAAFYREKVKEISVEGDSKWIARNQMNKRGSQSEDTLLNLMSKDQLNNEESIDHYVEIPPLEALGFSADKGNSRSNNTPLKTRNDGPNVPQQSMPTESIPSECDSNIKDAICLSTALIPADSGVQHSSSTQHQGSAEEQLSLENEVFSSETSSTDDEKLLALQKATDTETLCTSELSEDSFPKSLSKVKIEAAKEEAAAIAEYVTALPPFIPPKMKYTYPGGLSPVIEGLATSSINHPTHPLGNRPLKSESITDKHQVESSTIDRGVEKLSKAALSKRLAKETLRIMPPKEDENGNVWIPQRLLRRSEAVNGHGVSGDDGMNTASHRNDPLNEVRDHLDALSLSPHASTTGSPGIRPDDGPLRSSPASTTLRPRSGKEYHRIDRRRLTDEHSQGSSPLSPKSPSAGSIFTFDTPSSPSVRSFLSRDGESPASLPSPYMRGPYPCHSYVNLGKGPDNRPNLYVNMDMTPPSSPYRRTHMPLEQIDPQLNYAEIDLSHTGSDRSKKGKKGAQKAATIEYAMIDMVATAAVSKTRKEQAQSREDNLRRSGRKFSVPSVDRRTLGSGSFRDKDRGRKLSTSSVDSNG